MLYLGKFNDGTYTVFNAYGDILTIGISAETALEKYCRKYDCTMQQALAEIRIDDSSMLYDSERDSYMTIDSLREYYNDEADKEIYPTYSDYLRECTGKNGTLEYV